MNARNLAREIAYRSGAIAATRQRRSLTVATFHRVIDRADPDFALADPTYTVADDLFAEILDFFRAHYAIVSLKKVMAAADDLRGLPDYALLITFDDGWADNLRYGVPVLQRHRIPAVIFVAVDALLSTEKIWWQEQLFAGLRQGPIDAVIDRISAAMGALADPHTGRANPLQLLCRLAAMDEKKREALLGLAPVPEPASRMMLTPDDLPTLIAADIAIGIHGYTHLPLTGISDVEGELRRARSAIRLLTGDTVGASTLGLPHGRHDARSIIAAHRAGMRLIFSSDPVLTQTRDGAFDKARPIGRISLEASQLTNPAGRFDPARAATWLWRRDIV